MHQDAAKHQLHALGPGVATLGGTVVQREKAVDLARSRGTPERSRQKTGKDFPSRPPAVEGACPGSRPSRR